MLDSIFGRAVDYQKHTDAIRIEQIQKQMHAEDARRFAEDQRRIQASQQYVSNQGSGQAPVRPAPRFDPNKSEAFQISLSQAITMWKLKFGDQWFDTQQVRPQTGKDFYTDVCDRINNAGLFEKVDGWYRLKEDV